MQTKNALRSFRLVCEEKDLALVEALLCEEGFVFEQEPFCPFVRRLLVEPFPLGRSLAAFFGYIYIQDRSSMLPPLALNPPKGAAVLDMCASPGSKTGLLAQLVGKEGFILGNEPTKTRLATLKNTLTSLNLFHTATCSWDGEAMPYDDVHTKGLYANIPYGNIPDDASGLWDYILLDPPCSGWGTTNKNPNITKLWTAEKAKNLITLQQKLLRHAYTLLKDGGSLVYSTCTTNPLENEEQVRFACEELGFELVPLTGFETFHFDEARLAEGTLCVDEKASQAQGFFIAKLKKASKEQELAQKIPPSCLSIDYTPLDKEDVLALGFDADLLPKGDLAIFGENVHFVHEYALKQLPKALRWQGPILGKSRKGRCIPLPRVRSVLCEKSLEKCVFEDISPIKALLQGQSLPTDCQQKDRALYWRDLPLGRVRVKNGRIFWTEK